MSNAGFYSAARARHSLGQFLVGKVLSAATGIVFLVWVVRITPAAQYGIYMALLALLEVFYLATGLGLSTLAQRYVAEFRMQAPQAQFQQFLLMLLRRRLWAAGLGALLVAALWLPLVQALRLSLPPATRWWVMAWLVVGCNTRFLDEVLPALLLHGASQWMNTLSNLLRLAGLLALGTAPDHTALLGIELGVACVASAVGAWVLRQHLRAPGPAGPGAVAHHNPAMWAVARRFYLVQLLGQAWGPNMARLLVSRLAGVVQTAAFGFSQALVDLLRNYLPTYLLANWVRPLMVARYVATGRVEPVLAMAGAVFKLSLMVLLPFVGLLALQGDELARWVSAGRYGDGAGRLMAALVVLLALQSLHLGLGQVCTTLERAGANVWATAACTAALPLAWLLWPRLGLLAVPLALGAAELLWVTWVALSLRRAGFAVNLHWRGHGKVLLAGALSAAAVALWPAMSGLQLLGPALTSAAVMLAACIALRPLSNAERDLLAQVLPRRWLWL